MITDEHKRWIILIILLVIAILLIVAVSKKSEHYAPCGSASSKSCTVVGSSGSCSNCNAAVCTPTAGSWSQSSVSTTPKGIRTLKCSRP